MKDNVNNVVFKKIESLKSWVFLDYGLGLRLIIDNILEPIKTKISEKDINKFSEGAKILKNNNKITDWVYNKFIKELPERTIVHVNGKWHPVNKLNTNYSDLSYLLSDLLVKSKNDGKKAASEIIDKIVNSKNEDEIKNVLLKYKDSLGILFNKYIKSPEELFNYTVFINKKSEVGESVENNVSNTLNNLGYEIIYRGGDGDFIDMIFSTDIIVRTPKNQIKTIQVKTSEWQAKTFMKDFKNGKYGVVDILIYPNGSGFNAISTKTNKLKTFN